MHVLVKFLVLVHSTTLWHKSYVNCCIKMALFATAKYSKLKPIVTSVLNSKLYFPS